MSLKMSHKIPTGSLDRGGMALVPVEATIVWWLNEERFGLNVSSLDSLMVPDGQKAQLLESAEGHYFGGNTSKPLSY